MANRYDITKPVADQLRAVRDDYLMATPDKQDTAYAVITRGADTVADLLALVQMVLTVDDDWKALSLDERSRLEAAISKASGGAV